MPATPLLRAEGSRADTRDVRVSAYDANGGLIFGDMTWDKRTGGEVDSDMVAFKPGNMAPQVSLGGTKTAGNVTLSRLFYNRPFTSTHLSKLLAAVGKGSVTISDQPLDRDGNVFGSPIVWNGILKRVTPPEHDSESSAAALIEIEVTIDGYPTV